MLFQDCVGMDIRSSGFTMAWVRGGWKGSHLKAVENRDVGEGEGTEFYSQVEKGLSEFIEVHGLREFELHVGIGSSVILQREIQLPLSVREDVDSTLRYEIEKYIPLPLKEVVFDYAIRLEDKSTGLLHLYLEIIKRKDVAPFITLKDYLPKGISSLSSTVAARDQYLAVCRSGKKTSLPPWDGKADDPGIGATALACRKVLASGNRMINFLPEHFRKKAGKASLYLFICLAVACIFLSLGLLSSHLVTTRMDNQRLNVRLHYLKDEVGKVDQLITTVDGLNEQLEELQGLVNNRISSLAIMKAVTELVPETAWLEELIYSKGQIKIRGEAENAAALIVPLEDSNLFSGVGFESKITVKENGRESFVIGMKRGAQDGH